MTQVPPIPPQEAPPATYEYVIQSRPTVWHKVIGIIAIVFGSLGIVCTPIGLAANTMNPAVVQTQEMFPDWWQSYNIFSSFLGIGFAVLLLVAGISILRRRPSGRTLHLIYAGVAMVMCIVGVLITASMFNASSIPPEVRAGMMIGMVFGVLFGSAYPIFLLVLFLRAKIRDEVASWNQPYSPYAQGPTGGLPPQ